MKIKSQCSEYIEGKSYIVDYLMIPANLVPPVGITIGDMGLTWLIRVTGMCKKVFWQMGAPPDALGRGAQG
jgi:hypothetical protein